MFEAEGHLVAEITSFIQTEQTSVDMEIPMWWVYLCVPLGSSLMCYRFLQVAWSFSKTGELPHHDHGHVEGLDQADDLKEGQTA